MGLKLDEYSPRRQFIVGFYSGEQYYAIHLNLRMNCNRFNGYHNHQRRWNFKEPPEEYCKKTTRTLRRIDLCKPKLTKRPTPEWLDDRSLGGEDGLWRRLRLAERLSKPSGMLDLEVIKAWVQRSERLQRDKDRHNQISRGRWV